MGFSITGGYLVEVYHFVHALLMRSSKDPHSVIDSASGLEDFPIQTDDSQGQPQLRMSVGENGTSRSSSENPDFFE